MELKNNNIKLTTNNTGEISSIKYKDQEILHDGKEWGKKTYPVIGPNISNSKGFIVNDNNYKLPKHGFGKELNGETMIENDGVTLVATHLKDDVYPFSIDIQHRIKIVDDTVEIKTSFSNISKEKAYFHFGHHPAFLMDENTLIKQFGTLTGIKVDGQYTDENFIMRPASLMEFGSKIDTYVFKNLDHINASFVANNLEIAVQTDDFSNLLVGRPNDAKFICVEPMEGQSDFEKDDDDRAENKEKIITLDSGKTKTFSMIIKIKETKNIIK